jgi:hypothetical protein
MRRLAVVLAGGALALAAVAGFTRSAGALAPTEQGWWTSTNPGGTTQSLGVASPAPPDVPSNGLLVEGGPSAASSLAYAGLIYQVPSGATAGTLTLTVAPNSATTPDSILEVCPLTLPLVIPEQGGPMSDAPAYDCTTNTTAKASSSGDSFAFDVSKLASNGVLALAIVPTSATDRVVFSQPSATSLAVTQSTTTTSNTAPASAAGNTGTAPGSAAGNTGSATSPTFGNPSSSFSTPEPLATTPSSTPTATSQPVSQAIAPPPLPALSTLSQANPIEVILVLIGLTAAAVFWAAAGREKESSLLAQLPVRSELINPETSVRPGLM